MLKGSVGIIVFVFLFGAASFIAVRMVIASQTHPFAPNRTGITISPPQAARSATLSETHGAVLQKTRDATEFTEATSSGQIREGETLQTRHGAATVTNGPATLAVGEASELSFVRMRDDGSVFQQSQGIVEYSSNNAAVAVRALHLLIESTGTFTVDMEDARITVTVQSGKTTAAFVDADNTTHVESVTQGKRFVFDDQARTIEVMP